MNEHDPYQQGAFDLTPAETHTPESTPMRPVERPESQFHTLTPSSRRLGEGDFWPEYLHEVQTRERLGLPDVSPDEFEDMRDWMDGYLAPADSAWPPVPERPPYVRQAPEEWTGPDEEREGDSEAWADASRSEQSKVAGKTVFDARRAKLDATIDVLANKVEQIVTGEGYRAYLQMVGRFHPYSANNRYIEWTTLSCTDRPTMLTAGGIGDVRTARLRNTRGIVGGIPIPFMLIGGHRRRTRQ